MKKVRRQAGGFKPETIRKVTAMLNQAVNHYKAMQFEQVKLCLSSSNRKIGRVMNFSIAPIITCGKNCKGCKGFCYDVKACLQYPNTVIDARARNTVLAMYHREKLFAMIDAAMSRRRANKFFRWHVAGDILDLDYFARMVDNARMHPDFVIWTYTKQYHIVNEYCARFGRDSIPSNFHVMFSEWRGLPMDNPHGFPEFRVVAVDDEYIPTGFYCPGNCDDCKRMGRGCVAGETVYCWLH